jgi:hypothetical protein
MPRYNARAGDSLEAGSGMRRRGDEQTRTGGRSSPAGVTAVFFPGILVAIALALPGCARPEGDFGRAAPSYVHDEAMPMAGRALARARKEPVSSFNRTDLERQLEDQAWALIRPPHAGQWWMAILVEADRTRIVVPEASQFDPKSYYAHLRSESYRSSEARWSRLIAHATADAALVPPYCETWLRVERTDGERLAAIGRQLSGDEIEARSAGARVWENRRINAMVSRALAYRLSAYRNAVDRLEIETPSDQLYAANRAIDLLRAQIGCTGAGSAGGSIEAPVRKGRRLDGFDLPVPQK